MGQITSGIGLVSGINTGALINALMTYNSAPANLLNSQINSLADQETAYNTLETQLSAMQQVGHTLSQPINFQNVDANSSNNGVLTATASSGASVGSYQFQVARLVSTQQTISQGFADTNSTPIGAGTLTFQLGGGQVNSQTPLSALNGGSGIQSGQFRITDSAGNSAVIDTSNDITLDDVVKQINTASGINVHASVTDQGLVITDEAGGSGTLNVKDLNGGTSAASLGIAGPATAGVLTGSTINYVSTKTQLSQLNDGNGVTAVGDSKPDFTIATSDGSTFNISVAGAKTIGDVINDINTVGGSKLRASLAAHGTGIILTDTSGGAGPFTVTPDNGSSAASELGLNVAASGDVINGGPLVAGLDSVKISSLNGGQGLDLGSITITDGQGHQGTIDLSNATSFSDITNDINNNTQGLQVNASVDSSGLGLQLTDTSGGPGGLVVADADSTNTATALGVEGTFTGGSIDGGNLHRQYVSATTQLSTYNGGAGVSTGSFKITNSKGISTTITLNASDTTLGNVINQINQANDGVTAGINSQGNGLLLTDTAGGAGKLTVADESGTAAADLNIAGAATAGAINGAEVKTINVSGTDTLATLQNKINQLGFGVTASIISDGSSSDPYHLSLSAINSGQAGQVLIDTGKTGLNLTNLVNGQDAAVFYGGDGQSQPLLVTSSTNSIAGIINGVTINLVGASSSPVTLNVTNDYSNVVTQLQNFVTSFNQLAGDIDVYTAYNNTTNTASILLGDNTTQRIQTAIYNILYSNVNGTGVFNNLADIGITVNADASTNGATISFNQTTFENAVAQNSSAVQSLFTTANNGLGNLISNGINSLIDPVDGVITLENNTLNSQITDDQNSLNNLNAVLAEQRNQLQNEFNDMEQTLASLQSEQQALSALNSSIASLKTAESSLGSGSSSSSSSGSSSSGSSSGG